MSFDPGVFGVGMLRYPQTIRNRKRKRFDTLCYVVQNTRSVHHPPTPLGIVLLPEQLSPAAPPSLPMEAPITLPHCSPLKSPSTQEASSSPCVAGTNYTCT